MKTITQAKKLLTAEEFSKFCSRPGNDFRWFELVRGEVIELPNPKRLHGVVCGYFALYLGLYKIEVGWGEITSNDSGVILERNPDTVRGPDVAYYAQEEDEAGYSQIPPLVAIEVLSPDDKRKQVAAKVQDFLDNGVKLVWLADPAKRTVTVYRRGRLPRVLKESDMLSGEEVLPGFRHTVTDFFPKAKAKTNGRGNAARKLRNGRPEK